jgi:hypothetical protein
MPYVTVGKENSADVELYYEDHGDSILPINASGARTMKLIKGARHTVVKRGPARHHLDARVGSKRGIARFPGQGSHDGRDFSASA